MKSSSAIYHQIVDDVFNAIQHAKAGNRHRTPEQWIALLGYQRHTTEARLFLALYTKHAPSCVIDVDNNNIIHVNAPALA